MARLSFLSTLPAMLLCAAAVALPASAVADVPSTGPLTLRIAGLRSDKGQVGCMLFNAKAGFPSNPSAALQLRWCPIAGSASTCTFGPVPAGAYAAACFHDENGNGKLDTGAFGIPKEGTVASNQAKGFMGPPAFKDAKFSFAGVASSLELRMQY